jgi:ThiF family
MTSFQVRFPANVYARLREHLFQQDGGEHGAVVSAGIALTKSGPKLLAREVFPAREGTDYLPGMRGHRMLAASFVRERILYCRDSGLAYLAVHNHGRGSSVSFSEIDMQSHERGYPALSDIGRGVPVGALVFATAAAAGDIWLPGGERAEVSEVIVTGMPLTRLRPQGPQQAPSAGIFYDRQARLFGNAGQAALAAMKVGVVGAGGVGSLLVEFLARLGVGRLLVVDPDVVEVSNLSRLIGAKREDAGLGRRRRHPLPKVDLARRLVHAANPNASFEGIKASFQDPGVAEGFLDCDYIFLAADSMQARLLFNAIVHQYVIPGVQIGAKVTVDSATGKVIDAFSVSRPVTPGKGCLWCNGLITPSGLQEESATPNELRGQRYVEEQSVVAPSVIGLNAAAVSQATNDFMLWAVGLQPPNTGGEYVMIRPMRREVRLEEPRLDLDCPECSSSGRLALGDAAALPAKAARTDRQRAGLANDHKKRTNSNLGGLAG